MCHNSCLEFGKNYIYEADIIGKNVIEVGSLDVNGSVRPIIEAFQPATYLGVDIQPGPGVDTLCNVCDLVSQFGHATFDIVISTELLEHVEDWRCAISNLKQVVKPNGLLVITTRSIGFPYHCFPYDFWRYQLHDMQAIFADFYIETLITDPEFPGVFLKARKPFDFIENNLAAYPLYSVVHGGIIT